MGIMEVAQGVYRIHLAWGNVYLLKQGARAALIDTGLHQDRAALVSALAERDVKPEGLESVCLTHAHCDHAGNAAWLAQHGAKVLLHREEAPYLNPPRLAYLPAGIERLTRIHTTLVFLAAERIYPVERCKPDVLLGVGDKVDAPGGALRVIATPGHTKGHIAFWREKDGVLFSGDAVINIIPFRRRTALSLPIRILSDNWRQCIQSARQLAELKPAMLLAGHGRPLTEDTAAKLEAWARTLR